MKKKIVKCWFVALCGVMLSFTPALQLKAAYNQTTEYGVYQVLAYSNLRSTPSQDGAWLACLPTNAYVIMLDAPTSEFCHISYEGLEGYIYRGCIRKVEDEAIIAEVLGVTIQETEENGNPIIAMPDTVREYMEGQRMLADPNRSMSHAVANAEETENAAASANANATLNASAASNANVGENAGATTNVIAAEAANAASNASAVENMSDANLILEEDVVETSSSGFREISISTSGVFLSNISNETPALEPVYENAQIVANAVMRELPSQSSSKMTTILRDEMVAIMDEGENGYLHVQYNGREGYVYATVVSREGRSSRNTSGVVNTIVAQSTQSTGSAALDARRIVTNMITANAVIHTEENANVSVQTDTLVASGATTSASTLANDVEYQIRTRANMRGTPNVNGQWLATLPTGANVEVLGDTQGGYTLVQYNGIQGYVLESVVVDSIDVASAGSVLYTLTAYCACPKCVGNYSPEITGHEAHTATGTVPQQGRTIAVDPSVIPYGTVVHIEGLGDYVAEDCGGMIRGNHIDVYFDSHEEAVAFGRQRRYVTFN